MAPSRVIIAPMNLGAFRLRNRLVAYWKWALSFRSSDWELKDYPVSLRKQKPGPNSTFESSTRWKTLAFAASIINWNVSGSGNTKEEAMSDLVTWFGSRKAALAEEGKPLPRPGTKVPIQFAPQERVNAHPKLAQDLVERVLGFEWVFLSDESSLWHFHDDETSELLVAKIRSVYGVSVDDIESERIWEILDRIAESQKSS
jgi:hypothetical protein